MNFSLSIGIILSGKSGSIRKIHVRCRQKKRYHARWMEKEKRNREKIEQRKKLLRIVFILRMESSYAFAYIRGRGGVESARKKERQIHTGGFHVIQVQLLRKIYIVFKRQIVYVFTRVFRFAPTKSHRKTI